MKFYEAEATKIDYEKRVVCIKDESEIKGDISHTEVPFDMLVIGVGAENAAFGGYIHVRDKEAKIGKELTICRYSGCTRAFLLSEGGQRRSKNS